VWASDEWLEGIGEVRPCARRSLVTLVESLFVSGPAVDAQGDAQRAAVEQNDTGAAVVGEQSYELSDHTDVSACG
jgi:hypothetical protein